MTDYTVGNRGQITLMAETVMAVKEVLRSGSVFFSSSVQHKASSEVQSNGQRNFPLCLSLTTFMKSRQVVKENPRGLHKEKSHCNYTRLCNYVTVDVLYVGLLWWSYNVMNMDNYKLILDTLSCVFLLVLFHARCINVDNPVEIISSLPRLNLKQ